MKKFSDYLYTYLDYECFSFIAFASIISSLICLPTLIGDNEQYTREADMLMFGILLLAIIRKESS